MRHHYTALLSSVTFIVQTCIAHLYHFTVSLFSLAWQLSLLFQYHFHNLFLGSGFSLCSIDKLKHTMPFYCHFSMYVYLFFTHYHNTAAVFFCLSSSKRNYIYKMIHCSVPMERRLNVTSLFPCYCMNRFHWPYFSHFVKMTLMMFHSIETIIS